MAGIIEAGANLYSGVNNMYDQFLAAAGGAGQSNSGGSYPTSSGEYSGGGGGRSSADSEELALYDSQLSQLQKQLDRTGTGLSQGLKGLSDSYNKEKSSANLQRGRAIEGFNTQRTDTTTDKLGSIGQVNNNARNLANSVRRILGLASGSGSSAYQFAAPNAIAKTASVQRTNVNDTYGRNFRDLDTAEGRAKVDFQNLLNDLSEQKKTRESSLRAGVLENRNDISGRLAQVAAERARLAGGGAGGIREAQQRYISDIDSRNRSIDSLFERFRTPYNVKAVNVQKPDLAKYTVDRQAINANNQGGNSAYSPYAQPLKKKFEGAI